MLPLSAPVRDITSVGFSPDGRHLIAAFTDAEWDALGVGWFDPHTGADDHVLRVIGASVLAVAADGRHVAYAVGRATSGWHCDLRLYDRDADEHRALVQADHATPLRLAVADGGAAVAVGGTDERSDATFAWVWDGLKGWPTLPEVDPGAHAFAPDGKTLAVGSPFTPGVRLWRPRSEEAPRLLRGYANLLCWKHPDRLAAAGLRELAVWDPATGAELFAVADVGAEAASLDVSPDGRRVAVGGTDGLVRVWDLETRAAVATFEWRIGRVRGLAFAPDGLTCAAAGDRGRVVVWDLDS